MIPRHIIEAAIAGAAAIGTITAFRAYASLAPWSTLYGKALIAPPNAATGPGEIALTFDDGPNPHITPQLLDLLARNNIRATFFLIGRYAAEQPALARQIHAAGHAIGNHTWSHPNLARANSDKTREELARTNTELEQILGTPVRLFRPPFGARSSATFRIVRELGLTPVLWNVIGNDWNAKSADAIISRVTTHIARNDRRGSATNLVLHDGGHLAQGADRTFTVDAVRQLIASYADRRFVTLESWLA